MSSGASNLYGIQLRCPRRAARRRLALIFTDTISATNPAIISAIRVKAMRSRGSISVKAHTVRFVPLDVIQNARRTNLALQICSSFVLMAHGQQASRFDSRL